MSTGEDYLKRRQQRKHYSKTSSEFEWEPGTDLDQFPILSNLVSRRKLGETKRQLSTVLLFCEGGQLKALINDKDGGYTGFCRVQSLETAIEEIEALLAADKLDWREQKK